MQEVSAGLERFTFTFEEDVELQRGTGLLPFQGMDRSGSAVCSFFAKGLCHKAVSILTRPRGDAGVCKPRLRGLCKTGDQCKFPHQYDVTTSPECYFFDCNKECPFLHVKPDFKNKDCLWFDQDFCKDGPLYKYRHVHGIMCINYLAGFCPEGPQSHFAHSAVNEGISLPGSWSEPLPSV
uniref:Cleavage and polyadenylation specificity factor subunit 4 n=1 Tax=Sus scrofa TaxID=9823 RepID=A0A4X1SKS5_PIG